jgi:hypothetical protein
LGVTTSTSQGIVVSITVSLLAAKVLLYGNLLFGVCMLFSKVVVHQLKKRAAREGA